MKYKNSKIKILFILPSLVPGGAERVISFVANNINRNNFEPFLLIAGFEKDNAYDVSGLKTIYLNKNRILTAIPLIIKTIISIKPNVVLSSISHVNTAMAMISPFFSKIKFIGRESTVLSKRKGEKKAKKRSLVHFLPNGFKELDMLICQSQDMAMDMINNFQVPTKKLCVINNPISSLPPLKIKKLDEGIKKFITVGRLTEVKGYLRILDALSKLKIPFEYTIIGDGTMKNEIFEKAKKLGIYDKITHIAFTTELNKYFEKHDMFLQGSYVEGFPNALLECCVVGTPVLAFEAPGGTKEIVEDGVNGYIAKDEYSFLDRLKENRQWNPEEIRESVHKKFNKEKILSQYEDLFFSIINPVK